MGERWKIDGRRRGGCGPGMPGPYGGWKGERVLAGNGQAEGSRPLPTMQTSNRRRRRVAGRACPAPTGVVVGAVCFPHSAHTNVENACNFYLIIIV